MEAPMPPSPPPVSRRRPVLTGIGIAVLAVGAGLGAGWLLVRLAAFVGAHWRAILAVLVMMILLVALAAAGLGVRAHAQRQRARWLRRLANLERVDVMDGHRFEELVAELLRRDGFRSVQVIGRSGDGGVDVTARAPDGRRVAVQCKRHSRPVGADRVRNLIGAVHGGYAGHVGILVASHGFTRPAVAEGRDRLTLIDRDLLAQWLDGRPLSLDDRSAS